MALATSYESLLGTAGFVEIVATDLTTEYRATQRRWMDATERHEPAMRAAMGDDAYEERIERRRTTLDAIDAGLLSRFQYSARR